MFVTVDDYLKDVKERGTGPAMMLTMEELLMSGNLAKTLTSGNQTMDRQDVEEQIFCLLVTHRSMVLASYFMERAEGHPMATDGPIVVPRSVANPE